MGAICQAFPGYESKNHCGMTVHSELRRENAQFGIRLFDAFARFAAVGVTMNPFHPEGFRVQWAPVRS